MPLTVPLLNMNAVCYTLGGGGHMGVGGWVGGQTLKHSKTVNHSKTIKRSKTYKSLYSAAESFHLNWSNILTKVRTTISDFDEIWHSCRATDFMAMCKISAQNIIF